VICDLSTFDNPHFLGLSNNTASKNSLYEEGRPREDRPEEKTPWNLENDESAASQDGGSFLSEIVSKWNAVTQT
jgi:hypothetical protein